jgi:hypothetical protein
MKTNPSYKFSLPVDRAFSVCELRGRQTGRHANASPLTHAIASCSRLAMALSNRKIADCCQMAQNRTWVYHGHIFSGSSLLAWIWRSKPSKIGSTDIGGSLIA